LLIVCVNSSVLTFFAVEYVHKHWALGLALQASYVGPQSSRIYLLTTNIYAVNSPVVNVGHIHPKGCIYTVSVNNKNTHLAALYLGLIRWASIRKVKPIWIYWSRR